MLERASLCGGCVAIVQAAAGGVGLTMVTYAHRLNEAIVGTAGRAHKHAHLLAMGVCARTSSRNNTTFTVGAASLHTARRSHMVMNSLSLDFIAASLACLGQGGTFQEIGKRGIWSSQRNSASSYTAAYGAIALDASAPPRPRRDAREYMQKSFRVECA